VTDSRVRVRTEADGGQADAINRGFADASGEIFGWLNADDELEPRALEHAVAVLAEDSTADLVYGRGNYVDEAGTPLRPYRCL
jgi:GT2 family glycosyltransferase